MFLLLSLLFGCVDGDAPIDPTDTTPFTFEVPKGTVASNLGDELVEANLIGSELEWKVFLRTRDASCLKAGRFELNRGMSLNGVVDTLCGAPLADDVAFTVLEGWRIRDIDAALVEAGLSTAGAYTAVAEGRTANAPFEVPGTTYEGYLYPETYRVPAAGVDPKTLGERQLSTFKERFLDRHPDGMGKRTLHDIVIMASMLEREEPKPKNRNLVAGILWKRIDSNNALGVDATSRYTLDKWNDRSAFLKLLRDPEDPYNSRLRKGLPPTPIGNPTIESLEAALAPTESEFWYYLHDSEQNLHPARNANEHEANRAKYNVY